MSLVLGTGGVAGSYIFVAAVALVGVIAVAVLGTETRGQRLEQASATSPAHTHANPTREVEPA
jgi:hypothetical protein